MSTSTQVKEYIPVSDSVKSANEPDKSIDEVSVCSSVRSSMRPDLKRKLAGDYGEIKEIYGDWGIYPFPSVESLSAHLEKEMGDMLTFHENIMDEVFSLPTINESHPAVLNLCEIAKLICVVIEKDGISLQLYFGKCVLDKKDPTIKRFRGQLKQWLDDEAKKPKYKKNGMNHEIIGPSKDTIPEYSIYCHDSDDEDSDLDAMFWKR